MLLTGISGTVGGEFKAAIEEAQAVQARIVFGDQSVEITSSRMASRVGFRVRRPRCQVQKQVRRRMWLSTCDFHHVSKAGTTIMWQCIMCRISLGS